jgi:glyoxylase-like metal-dependent hydrolase (beta-lactamase superfamily II)
MMILGHPGTAPELVGKAFQTLTHNQRFRLGKLSFTALHTPGHYYDSITYQLESVLFTGDTLFVGRTGRVISARSNIEKLYDSIYNIILTLPKNIRIYPGHDYGDKPTISLKDNIVSSSLLQASDLKDFKARMLDYENNRQPGS